MAAGDVPHYVVAAGEQNGHVAAGFWRRPDLRPGPKVLYQVLKHIAVGERVFASLEQLAEETATSVASVERYLEQLRAVGLVETRRIGKQLANVYTLDPSREVGPPDGESPGGRG